MTGALLPGLVTDPPLVTPATKDEYTPLSSVWEGSDGELIEEMLRFYPSITDMVNCHRSQWPHCDFMHMAEEAGFTVCDLIVKVRTGPMVSTKWKNAHHARKRHCFWIICRNGRSCER